MNHKCLYLCFFLVAIIFFSCTKKDYSSYCPTWKGFTYTTGNYPNYVMGSPGNKVYMHPGDSIHLTAHQDERGHLINSTDYSWTICYDTLDTNGYGIFHRNADIFPTTTILFEGEEFRAPANPQAYARNIYGDDFMQLPPSDKRKVHAVFYATRLDESAL